MAEPSTDEGGGGGGGRKPEYPEKTPDELRHILCQASGVTETDSGLAAPASVYFGPDSSHDHYDEEDDDNDDDEGGGEDDAQEHFVPVLDFMISHRARIFR